MRILALDIGGTAIKSALFDGENLLSHDETPSSGKAGGPSVMEKVRGVIAGYPAFDRLAVSTAGQVDTRDGSILFANENIPKYTGMRVREILERATGRPVRVLNDVQAAALGEAVYGAGKGYRDFVCVTLGTGIGGGIFVGGRPYIGAAGVAGEIGHMSMHPGGLICACGQRGCWEQYASVTALLREARRITPSIQDGRGFFAALPEDSRLRAVFDRWIDEIVTGLATLAHILNPAAFVLGGGVMDQDIVLEAVRQRLYPRLMPSYRTVDIVRAALKNLAGVYGAMAAVRDAGIEE